MTTINAETGEINALANISDEELLEAHYQNLTWEADAVRRAGETKQDIHRRLRETGAKVLYGKGLEYVDKTANEYDRTQLGAIAEVFTPVQMKKCFTPAHEETKEVPDKWDMTPFKTAVNAHGLQKELERITFKGSPRGELVPTKTE